MTDGAMSPTKQFQQSKCYMQEKKIIERVKE